MARKARLNPKHLLIAAPLIVLLLLGMVQGKRMVFAGIYNHQTQQYLDFWDQQLKKKGSDFTVREKDFDVALKGANKALDQLPKSGEQWVFKARVLDWGQKYGLFEESGLTNDQYLSVWKTATELRPFWPYSYLDYAMARAQLSLIDDEFEGALLKANQYGPWEKRVMETTALLASHYRDWLSEPTQRELDKSMDRLARHYPRQARTFIEQRDKALKEG
ncbi:hypothetical protein EOPP23_14865 [Endozoicomonas sp. OPT23]|uniref:hypothetical protein n=1 Tax=Endozoicomonas sp. OPT23 TaxID=2072845 RepID=UPI001891D5CE|nr:hypothetical protein [Endozoicomonas sp. OPT23]MRI34271.1 hypothetical protein [Endozoicomonas sp. OPT23]